MFNLKLWPKQEEVLQGLRSRWKQDRTHLVYANVGFGKTAIAAAITAGFIEKGLRVLFIAPYTTLVMQTAQRFMEYGLPKPGIIWQQHEWTDPTKLIQIGSVDTLIRRDFPEIDLLIVDECHIRRSKLLEIIDAADFPVIGLSGTPFTKWLGTYYENLVKVTTMREMIDTGYLSEFEIFAPYTPDMDGVKTSNTAGFGTDYVEDQVAEIMNGYEVVADIVSTWLQHGENEPTIAFCVNVAHANQVANEFCSAGVECEVMTAATPKDERTQIIKRFELGVTRIICNVGVLVAGFDSDVRCIIYARPTKSEIRWIQCLGRGLRTAEGKSRLLIFDHSGTVHRLGYPDGIEYDSLNSSSDGMEKVDRVIKEIEKLEKLPKECPGCHFMKPAGMHECSKCGFIPRAGQDVETDRSRELVSLKAQLTKPPTKADKQKFYSELLGYYFEKLRDGKGWKKGWVANKYKDKFGTWPSGLAEISMDPSKETKNYIISQNIRNAKRKPADTAVAKVHLDNVRELLG